ncbi:transcriptional regulator, AraC family domain protein [Cellvibrio sp. BR]|jgi:AraC-like DNA-binding protein|uniref:helix-turn-helix domain-containing protein n=1 Tax=unclassified Cellvibrio TaxID=2624793 RepID=UPI000260113D|nr:MULTISPECIES: AraC family transcriptional regulator [unclassified Cellvibrio]EIK43912.1 transcriptional regulator, AraC family domain protein [Cellvibrio sp. BR]QEY13712.1 AraC family transcriptional regulator [Cellvibrio sp. KY-YJ-3]UUA72881.1 AraC family transcriptional regulator [Cellvibrio sp. QJXJ]
MLTFYKNALAAFIALLLLSAALLQLGASKSQLTASLFPARDGNYLWHSAVEPKVPDGKTRLSLKNEVGTVEYEFFLDPHKPFPYTHYTIAFMDSAQPQKVVDLTQFSSVSFKVLCDPKNVLLFALFSFDDKVTDINKPITRRVSSTAFSCSHDWATINIQFDELDTPYWWLGRYGFEHSDTGYRLDKTMGFAWVNSLQSPLNTPSYVKITDVQLLGNNFTYLYVAIALVVLLWVVFLIVLLRRYVAVLTVDIRERVRLDQPLMAYKKLSIAPQKDKEKSAVLRFMATEYANPELSLEIAATTLGTNRTKINDILKEELGLTFTAYLNKLRLTEAARLLSENEEANVSEIAYLVGYNNVSYFNKLFKAEYGCVPKTFKALYPIKELS